jgi:hypothetical protein
MHSSKPPSYAHDSSFASCSFFSLYIDSSHGSRKP